MSPQATIYGKSEPFLAFAVLLATLIAASFIIQFIGDVFAISLVRYALPAAFLPCLGLTYGYFFSFSRTHIGIGLMLAVVLAALGAASGNHLLDFTFDSLDYQQPSVNDILHGWNPLYTDVPLIWQKIYPFGVWSQEASLAALYGLVEAARMLNIWWIFIVIPLWLSGLRNVLGELQPYHYALVWLLVLNPIVIGQCTSHYVDALVYLQGIAFIGALMLQGNSPRRDQLSLLLMAIILLCLINTKLSGVYWGVMLSIGALLYRYCEQKKFSWNMAAFLFVAGLASTVVFGWHPYMTNLLRFGGLLPMKSDILIAAMIPANFKPLPGIVRYFYSLFSIEEEASGKEAILKWPWIVYQEEWSMKGFALTSGLGPLFALGLLFSLAVFFFVLFKKKAPVHKGIFALAVVLWVFCIGLPESWWARYAPFTYAVPFLLLASCRADARASSSVYLVLGVFAVNSFIAADATYWGYMRTEAEYDKAIHMLHTLSPHTVYLVPQEGEDYKTYNHAYIAIQRRLHAQGIDASIQVGASCDHKVANWVEFDVCYKD